MTPANDPALTSANHNPLVSIVILNYNGARFIDDCLRAVLADSYSPKEILLVDNASRDDSLQMALGYQCEGVTVVANTKNYGFPRGCNEGIALARGEVIVLLNVDTIVQPGWLSGLIAPLLEDEKVGITASKLLFFDGKTLQFAGGDVSPNGLTHHRGHGIPDDGSYDQPSEIGYATGASMAIRYDLLERLGGLDEGFPLYFEDVDLSLRAFQAGYRIVYAPDSVVWHYETFGTRKRSAAYFYKYHRGRMRLILKQFGLRYFLADFLPAELRWYGQCDLLNQAIPLLGAYLTQLPKAPWFWVKGFLRRRSARA